MRRFSLLRYPLSKIKKGSMMINVYGYRLYLIYLFNFLYQLPLLKKRNKDIEIFLYRSERIHINFGD